VIGHPEIVTALGIGADDLFHVMQDRSGVMWYCTREGIFRQSGASLKHFLPDPKGDKNGSSGCMKIQKCRRQHLVPGRSRPVSGLL
jgi:hypothetical protein